MFIMVLVAFVMEICQGLFPNFLEFATCQSKECRGSVSWLEGLDKVVFIYIGVFVYGLSIRFQLLHNGSPLICNYSCKGGILTYKSIYMMKNLEDRTM